MLTKDRDERGDLMRCQDFGRFQLVNVGDSNPIVLAQEVARGSRLVKKNSRLLTGSCCRNKAEGKEERASCVLKLTKDKLGLQKLHSFCAAALSADVTLFPQIALAADVIFLNLVSGLNTISGIHPVKTGNLR